LPLRLPLAPVKYLGSKRGLLDHVVPIIHRAWSGGRVVDAFSGMATIGLAVSEFAPVTCVDYQEYARVVGHALVVRGPGFNRCVDRARWTLEGAKPVRNGFFSRTYGGSYFTAVQAADIDSIRAAVHVTHRLSTTAALTLCALYHGMSKAVAAPGHFAQPLNLASASRERTENVRQRSLAFLDSILAETLPPPASMRNLAIRSDVTSFLSRFREKVDVIFADPPYSSAQYSRFYHLLETVTLADKPPVTGRGLYRPARYASPFCRKSEVREAFRAMVFAAACSSKSLVLTYPSATGALNGLGWSAEDVARVAARYFKSINLHLFPSRQSMLGGKGRLDRIEAVLVAQRPCIP